MSKKNSGSDKSEVAATDDQRLRTVRELIFGDNMAEYQKEFATIREQLKNQGELAKQNLQSESGALARKLTDESTALQERIDALEYSMNESLKKLEETMRQEIDRLDQHNGQMLESRRDLGKALGAIADTLQQS